MDIKKLINRYSWIAAGAILAAMLTLPWALFAGAEYKVNMLEINLDAAKSELEDSSTRIEDLEEGWKLAGKELVVRYAGEFFCTSYCTEKYPHICGTGDGITASGQPIQAGVTVAADTNKLPFGTVIYIEDVGIRIVQDRGGAIKGNRIDVAVDTHENALKWDGQGTHKVYVIGGVN